MWRRLRKSLLAPLLRVHADHLVPSPLRRRSDRLGRLADMAAWWRENRGDAPVVPTREDLYSLVLGQVTPRLYLEFGVAAGASMRWWVDQVADPDSRFAGFDTFEGLPESWGSQPPGTYTAGGTPPDIGDHRVSFQVGRFEDTLPRFVDELAADHPLVVHLDADLYSSTAFVLRELVPLLEPGDVLIFDELLDVGTADHEFAAFIDIAHETELSYRVLGSVRRGPQVAVRLGDA